jgi:predicted metalloprotease with PDZ domain
LLLDSRTEGVVSVARQNHSKIVRATQVLLSAFLLISCELAKVYATSSEPARVAYELRYAGMDDPRVSLRITPESPLPAPARLVIPRSYPGGYSFVPYDDFVEDVHAFGPDGKSIQCKKDADGPRWTIGQEGERISRIGYRVNVGRMEDRIRNSVGSSKVRKNYVGLLGYSVFGYVDGLEQTPVSLQVDGPGDWPVLSTLDPRAPVLKGTAKAQAANYDILADSQIVMGPNVQVRNLPGKIDLLVAVYSEGDEDIDAESKLAREALDRVQEYFGDVPFPAYTVLLELLQPREGHEYNFSQEHDTSGTFSLSVDRATNAHSPDSHDYSALFNYAHHMAHSWVPKRVWGVGYRPFNWELPPVIETIWFNEGFGRYAGMQALAAGLPDGERKTRREREMTRTRGFLDAAPPFIKQMPLTLLSQEASFLYATDFRTGMNIFGRGFLMAAEMDDRIQAQTSAKKSLRDAFRALLIWNSKNQRALQVEEMARIISESTGVDVHDIVAHWMEAPLR